MARFQQYQLNNIVVNNVGVDDPPDAANMDSVEGYSVGSMFIQYSSAYSTSNIFMCMDASPGAAKWRCLGFTTSRAPSVSDGTTHGFMVGDHWNDTGGQALYICYGNDLGAAVWGSVAVPY